MPEADSKLAQTVRDALEWDKSVPHERIRTRVSDGIVTMEGTVESWNQSVDALRAICGLPGVHAIKNMLAIAPRHLMPSTVRLAVEHALEREAASAAALRIEIVIADGRVILKGPIPAWAEIGPVLDAVRAMPGVVEVENLLEKEP